MEDKLTLTRHQIDAIQAEIDSIQAGSDVREIHVRAINGSSVIVTADAGYGTYSFYVNRNGRKWQAELGSAA